MTQTSYPIVGANITRPQWQKMFDPSDGIIGDLTGLAGALTFPTADTATVAAMFYRVDGHVLEVSAPETFTLAAVGSPTTYTIGVKRTTANESLAGVGPLSLVAGVKGAVTGDTYRPIWEVPRTASTALNSGSPKTDLRIWAGELVEAASVAALPASPRGSVGLVDDDAYLRTLVGATLTWVSLTNPTWQALGGIGGIGDVVGHPSGWRVVAGSVELKGVRFKSSGVTTFAVDAPTQIGSVVAPPTGYVEREWSTHFADVNIKVALLTSGAIMATPYGPGVTSIRLDGARFALT